MRRLLVIFLLSASISFSVFAQDRDVEWQKVETILGHEGVVQDGVLKLLFPRSDLHILMNGITIDPNFALSSWVGFKKAAEGPTMLMGDFALLDKEVEPVLKKLIESGFEVSAAHNHFISESPPIKFVHFMGHGDAVSLAKKLKSLFALTGTPLEAAPALLTSSESPKWKKIEDTLGYAGKRKGNLLLFSIARAEVITEHGVVIPPIMGMASAIHFQEMDNKVVAAGDITVLPEEVNPVVRSLIKSGITVTAIHNHTIYESPRFFSVHFWGYGEPNQLAKGIHLALSQTRSSQSHP